MEDNPKRLERAFFARSALEVASQLIGKVLVHQTPEGICAGIIVDTEAYMGAQDPASHAYGGRRTPRTQVLFGKAGVAYIYLIWGMHACMNIVTGGEGVPQSVFIRALEPIQGLELMRRRRGVQKDAHLTDGPGKLCRALELSAADSGRDLCGDGHLYILDAPVETVQASRRINIDYAGEARDFPWRFTRPGSPWLSTKLR
nr:DNA-3-methyladenine glycosylase [bacterium]